MKNLSDPSKSNNFVLLPFLPPICSKWKFLILSLSHSLTLSGALSLSHSESQSHCRTFARGFSLIITYSYTHLSLSHSPTHAYTNCLTISTLAFTVLLIVMHQPIMLVLVLSSSVFYRIILTLCFFCLFVSHHTNGSFLVILENLP